MASKYSIIMPSFLGYYRHAAENRESKFIRAVNSVIKQTFTDWELIIVSDGCEITNNLFTTFNDERLRLVKIEKQKNFSAEMRNAGLRVATGEYVCYLDTDDMLGIHHLETIDKELNGFDWVYFSDLAYKPQKEMFEDRRCYAGNIGKCGTSNFCHKRTLGELWKGNGYGKEDLNFARNLMKSSKHFKKIETPYYYVCHIPRKYDI